MQRNVEAYGSEAQTNPGKWQPDTKAPRFASLRQRGDPLIPIYPIMTEDKHKEEHQESVGIADEGQKVRRYTLSALANPNSPNTGHPSAVVSCGRSQGSWSCS